MTTRVADDQAAAALLAGLEGCWEVDRRIVTAGGGEGTFAGRAAFEADGAGALAYREVGVLRLPGTAPMQAERRHVWRAECGRVVVTFADGRAFHAFTPDAPRARHLCGADVYEVSYRFEALFWEARWRVRGPAKSYVMRTRYHARRPLAPPGGLGQSCGEGSSEGEGR